MVAFLCRVAWLINAGLERQCGDEADARVEDYISRNGRRPKAPKLEDDTCETAIQDTQKNKKAP